MRAHRLSGAEVLLEGVQVVRIVGERGGVLVVDCEGAAVELLRGRQVRPHLLASMHVCMGVCVCIKINNTWTAAEVNSLIDLYVCMYVCMYVWMDG